MRNTKLSEEDVGVQAALAVQKVELRKKNRRALTTVWIHRGQYVLCQINASPHHETVNSISTLQSYMVLYCIVLL